MNNILLTINDLNASAEGKIILHDLNLQIKTGETHVLMGPNGAGKSTLGNAILGNSQYTIDNGSVFWKNENITALRTNERAKKGIFMSFQNPVEIPGISVSQFIRTAMESFSAQKIRFRDFRLKMNEAIKTLNIDPKWVNREVNVGFSGGERKKIEMLQLLMLEPQFAILDETDSGLDVDAVKTVSRGIEIFQKNSDRSLLIITHNSKILQYLNVDFVHVIVNGTIVKTGNASLIDLINKQGYEPFIDDR